ncbi:hypothetical protein [Thermococcus sp.]|uniref:hypothetical protein n=1 Tax=Thermococcus sp. TaxID=35749 RepID=UPI0025E48040|nr:hypothetical protein [Thermococcus sp.]
MSHKTIALALLIMVTLWGFLKASSSGYLSGFDAHPSDLNLSVRAENNTLTVEWTLEGGEIIRAISKGRDAVILVYPGWVETEDGVWSVIGDASNVSVVLNGRRVNFAAIYYPYGLIVSNGSKNATIRIFDVPFDFSSAVASGRIVLRFSTYYTCNNFTVNVIYFHSTGRGEYHSLVLPLSVSLGEGFPKFSDFRSEFNFTIGSSEMGRFLGSAVNAHNLGDWVEEPGGWLVVKRVNVTVCPPKTS